MQLCLKESIFAMNLKTRIMKEENYSRVAVKIGSNVLARKDGTLDITRMSALVDQIAELHRQGIEVIMITSGAVASGRSELASCADRFLPLRKISLPASTTLTKSTAPK